MLIQYATEYGKVELPGLFIELIRFYMRLTGNFMTVTKILKFQEFLTISEILYYLHVS